MDEQDTESYRAAVKWAAERGEWWGEAAEALVEGAKQALRIRELPEEVAQGGYCGIVGLLAALDPATGHSRLNCIISGCNGSRRALQTLEPFEKCPPDVRGSMAMSALIAVREATALPMAR